MQRRRWRPNKSDSRSWRKLVMQNRSVWLILGSASVSDAGFGDALREVPGLSVVQTGTAGQLTSVFLRGLPSQDMQVLLNGIPINQGLAGQFDFANLTTDDIDRIEVVRGPQSTIYGPHALAGVVQIFTKRGE